MIEVSIKSDGRSLGTIKIENVSENPDAEFADYSIRFGVNKNQASGVHQRAIYNFPRTRYNVLALVLQALNTLEPEFLELHEELDDNTPKIGWRNFFS